MSYGHALGRPRPAETRSAKPRKSRNCAVFLRRSAPAATGQPCPLGLPALDAVLGGGLPTGCLQEMIGGGWPAAAGFAPFCWAVLQRARCARDILWGWVGEGDLYPPGLAPFGLDPARVLLLSAPSPADLLWAMEEALRCPLLAGVVWKPAHRSRRQPPSSACGGDRRRHRISSDAAAGHRRASVPPPCAGASAICRRMRWRVGAGRWRAGRPRRLDSGA